MLDICTFGLAENKNRQEISILGTVEGILED